MTTIRFCQTAAVLAASALLMPAAQAASASATLTGVYVQVFDLDPLDGVTAAFTLSYDGTWVNGNATSAPFSYSIYGALGSGTAGSAGDGIVGASSAVSGGDFYALVGRPGATASATASGSGTFAEGIGWVLGTNFTLTANTLVVIRATASASASAALGERAYASAYLQLSDDAGNYSIGQAVKSIESDGSIYVGTGSPVAAKVSYVTGDDSVTGFVGVYAQASTYGVAAVPEPATYGLLAAGLLALGFVAHRRRSDR